MKILSTLFAFSLFVSIAGHAFAASEKKLDKQYQQDLLKKDLPENAKGFCSTEKGEAYKKCHVTRLYLIDIGKNVEKGYPPFATIAFCVDSTEDAALNARRPEKK